MYSWDEEVGETRPPVSLFVVLPEPELHSCFNVVVVAFAWWLRLAAAASDPLPATSTGFSRTGKQAAAVAAAFAEDALEPELDSLRQLGSAFAGANIEDVIQGLLLLHRGKGGCSDQAG